MNERLAVSVYDDPESPLDEQYQILTGIEDGLNLKLNRQVINQFYKLR